MNKKDKYYLDVRTLVNGKKSIINLDNVLEILSKEDTEELVASLGGVTKHSQLVLDDGTNPHGTTKADVGLPSVPDTDFTSAVTLNTAKVGITPTQANAIVTNTAKVSFPEAPIDGKQYIRINSMDII